MNRTIGLLASAALLGACSDDPSGPSGPVLPGQSSALVSAPSRTAVTRPAVLGTPPTVYVSMPPGTHAGGTGVTIRNRGDGPSVSTPMIDGGFDPVAIFAAAGDSLVILVSDPDGVAESFAKVPAQSRPVVVRTAPRHRRTDVPLNSIVRVVFDEPMDSASVVAAVRLRRGEQDVAGTVTGISVNGDVLAATLEPAEPLDPATDYTIVISEAARSRQGTPLDASVRADFTTGDGAATGTTLTVTVATSGSDLDQDGYAVTVGGATDRDGSVGINGSFIVADAGPGLTYVALAGISQNCTPGASNIPDVPGWVRSVTVDAGESAAVAFEVTCRPVGTGTLAVTTATTGADPDADGYRVTIEDGAEQAIGPNATLTFTDLADTSGVHVELSGMSGNCRHVQPETFWWWGTIATDAVTTAAFSIECDAATFAASGLLTFSSETASGSAIWVSNADGTGRVQLTDGTAYDAAPTWSPDGQRLAFSRYENGTAEIYAMNADGSNQVRLTSTGYNTEPDWSPDGQLIAFSGYGGVHVTKPDPPDRGFVQRVGSHDFWSASPAWSPDGSRLAFVGLAPGATRHELYIMNADGSGLRKVDVGPDVAGGAESPAWSPDGGTIAIVVQDAAAFAAPVVLVNEDGSGARIVGEGWDPVWAPDGSGIAFSARNCQPCVRYVGVDGGASRQVIHNGAGAAWRP